ncbi:MAG: polysaccharide deacetylase family protein [Spirosomataceae bacterium]
MFLYKYDRLFQWAFPRYHWKIPTQEKVIYLTFDDGPIPDVTEWVLEQLAVYQAKATFFCIGDNIRKHLEVFQQVQLQGHAIGNHTYNHLNGWKTDTETYLRNVDQCAAIMAEHADDLSNPLFRPPYGRFTKDQASHILKTHRAIMWNVLTGDFSKELSPETILQKSIQYSEAGSIVVFHDSLKAQSNLTYVLPRYLAHFAEQGYRFEHLASVFK